MNLSQRLELPKPQIASPAREQGLHDAWACFPRSANPYPWATQEYVDWSAGYSDAIFADMEH